jgi:poly(3-hydroxybutyrate) depolymerase
MAFRLIFESDGDRVRLVRKMRVDMDAPAQPASMSREAAGVFAELRNAADETIHQVSMSQQIESTREVFAPGAEVRRVDASDQKRVAMIVVPESPDAEAVVVVRRGGEGAGAGGRGVRAESAAPAEEELERVSLRDDESPA